MADNSLGERLKTAAAVTGGLSAACYVIGLLVVNIHLRRFGYYSMSLFEVHYVVAGILSLVPVGLGWCGFALFAEEIWEAAKGWKLVALLIGLLLGLMGSFVVLVLQGAWIEGLPFGVRFVVLIIAGFFVTLYPAAAAQSATRLLASNVYRKEVTVSGAVVIGLSALVVVGGYLVNFSRSIYGEIPATLGGGQPRAVRLVVKNEVKASLAGLGVPFAADGRTSERVRLLLATEKEYVILTGKEGSVGIRGDAVDAIFYEPR
ncbi:MAG: hypothetical protein HY238_04270 [Acidobacteria bacterium]|nr:hypothetical protein [Acidobacteriota bacterium]